MNPNSKSHKKPTSERVAELELRIDYLSELVDKLIKLNNLRTEHGQPIIRYVISQNTKWKANN